MEEAERIQTQIGPDRSEQLRSIRVWRLEQFTRLGFDPARATLMADDAQVELAQARRLIALGCPLETASPHIFQSRRSVECAIERALSALA